MPTYTVFVLAYFTEDPKATVRELYAAQEGLLEIDRDYYPTLITEAGLARESSYDLAQWATDGFLGWLDVFVPDLPLKIGTGSVLPDIYRSIQGKRKPYTWRRGGWPNRS